jgi:hypothetical protein
MVRSAADLPSDPAIIVTNPEEVTPEMFRAWLVRHKHREPRASRCEQPTRWLKCELPATFEAVVAKLIRGIAVSGSMDGSEGIPQRSCLIPSDWIGPVNANPDLAIRGSRRTTVTPAESSQVRWER